MTLADVDGDGDLDLYVANNRKDTLQDEIGVRFRINVTNGVSQVTAVNERSTTAPDLTNRFYLDAQGGVRRLGLTFHIATRSSTPPLGGR